ncbi:hypothetical protein OAK91_02840 [Planctomycetaceae bacterium]|nr:hypothetical protein [Planctomycetaceae bacterium]
MCYPSQGELQKRYQTAVEAKRRLALNHMAVQGLFRDVEFEDIHQAAYQHVYDARNEAHRALNETIELYEMILVEIDRATSYDDCEETRRPFSVPA